MATLLLPTSPRTSVFRKIDSLLRQDPTLSAVFGGNIYSWQGQDVDAIPLTVSMAPCMRLTPINGPEIWRYPDSFVGWLFINVELVVSGYDYDDILNLWWAIEKAIYPSDPIRKLEIIRELQDVGAHGGLPEFSQPAFDPKPESNYFHCAGQIKVQVQLDLNW